jgi:phage shock protein E
MDFEAIKSYLLPAGIAAYLLLRYLRFKLTRKQLPALAAQGAVFVDVRTPAEFAAGNKPGSVNIPLDQFPSGAGKLDKTKPVILCCASGARSGVAAGILRTMGFTSVTNAGPWQNTL